MSIYNNINGINKEIDKPQVNIGGVWRECSTVNNNIDGTWRESYSGKKTYTINIYKAGNLYHTLTCEKGNKISLPPMGNDYSMGLYTGYSNCGYTTNPNGTTKEYNNQQVITPTSDMNLYSVFRLMEFEDWVSDNAIHTYNKKYDGYFNVTGYLLRPDGSETSVQMLYWTDNDIPALRLYDTNGRVWNTPSIDITRNSNYGTGSMNDFDGNDIYINSLEYRANPATKVAGRVYLRVGELTNKYGTMPL